MFVISLPRSGDAALSAPAATLPAGVFLEPDGGVSGQPGDSRRHFGWLGGQDPPEDLASTFGATRGWRGPNQGWRLWNRWLPESLDYIDPDRLDPTAVGEMRATVDQLQRQRRAPFVSKWQRMPLPACARGGV